MKSFGPLYVDLIKYPIFVSQLKVEKGWTNETEEPFRRGSCLVIKPPFIARACVIGIWGEAQEEDVALTSAVNARPLDVSPDEILEW